MALSKSTMQHLSDKIDMKAIRISWIDSRMITGGWQERNGFEKLEPTKIETIGFVVEDNKDYVTLCHSYEDSGLAGVITIPKCCITKTIKLCP